MVTGKLLDREFSPHLIFCRTTPVGKVFIFINKIQLRMMAYESLTEKPTEPLPPVALNKLRSQVCFNLFPPEQAKLFNEAYTNIAT